ncbi:MAG: rod shape-determining protein MreD [Tranquillimonas sp.]|jgi:rod shape-determining protein MreD
MVDPVTSERWLFRAVFAGLAALIIFLRLLPFQIHGGGVPSPDVIEVLAFVWVLRRPDYVPPLLIAAILLVADLLFLRPIGLWAGLVVLGLEFLRGREHLSRDLPFLLEWGLVGLTMAAVTAAHVVVLGVFMVPQPPLAFSFLQLAVTILAYPPVVALTRYAFGIRKMAPGQVDALGHRL